MNPAAERIRQADDEAHAAMVAMMRGPDAFLEYMNDSIERIIKTYAEDRPAGADGAEPRVNAVDETASDPTVGE